MTLVARANRILSIDINRLGLVCSPLRAPRSIIGNLLQLDRLPVRRVPIRVGPRFFSADELRSIRQLFRGDEALERRQPILVVAGPVVGFSAIGRGL